MSEDLLNRTKELAALLLAPTGMDADMMAAVMEKNGIAAEICQDMESLCARLDDPAGVIVIAEEGLFTDSLSLFQKKLLVQPAWSDLPVIVLSSSDSPEEASVEAYRFFAGNNINFLERPLRSITLLSSVRAALKAREKQYQVRDLIFQQEEYLKNLKQTNLELANKNKELEQFAYVASHDLQEPLRTVVTYCELIQMRLQKQLDNETEEFMKYLIEASLRAKQLVSDLLSYSRIDRQKKLDWVDFEKVMRTACDNLRLLIEENKAVITHDQLPRLLADETQTVQLFQNLISNAIKFKRESPPKIHVSSFTRRENGQEECVFSAADNGIGIERKYWKRIFDIFQRLSTQYDGTGIGLAVCKKIVERHKGQIWIDSDPGKGTTFYFSFPMEIES